MCCWEAARTLWAQQGDWNRRIRELATRELLDLKNSNWLAEDEPVITADDFTDRMRLESISVNGDGSFEFFHDDGDLFWGHTIIVGGNLRDGPTSAQIAG